MCSSVFSGLSSTNAYRSEATVYLNFTHNNIYRGSCFIHPAKDHDVIGTFSNNSKNPDVEPYLNIKLNVILILNRVKYSYKRFPINVFG